MHLAGYGSSFFGLYLGFQTSSLAPTSSLVFWIPNLNLDLKKNLEWILVILHRYAYTERQEAKKPGRDVVTFLLVCNLAMWTLNSLETNRTDAHPIQVQ